jgi:Skp family chaperone for outer membrane proteins
MRRPVDQAKVQEHQQRLTDRQNERLARLQEQLQKAEQERADRGTFHLKDGNGNVIPHKTDLDS